ncbi:MAG: aminopeptidase P family protein [Myxococcota bacterium]|jgi:Xaa-Pro aminopeptidase|nr:aminopeptidase P family protein [Myxococcota bacterium]
MTPECYRQRRRALRETTAPGPLLLLGARECPRNYTANTYPFRQDAHFLYYSGINRPGLALLIDDEGHTQLFGPADDPDDLIWCGEQPSLTELAEAAGIEASAVKTFDHLQATLEPKLESLHYLPPYHADRLQLLALLRSQSLEATQKGWSRALASAIAGQRSIKTEAEVAEHEEALQLSAKMYAAAFAAIRPGRRESEIAAALQEPALAQGRQQSFLPIVTVHGEVLHNNHYHNELRAGQLLLIDSGTESRLGYASDITRSVPVSPTFTTQQREIYEIVLDAQCAVIEAASPQCSNLQLHMLAARRITEGLMNVGLMKGDPEEAVTAGAHALFFPHGIGHMLGLDVHDMEDLGDLVGYAPGTQRSPQFGLRSLRLARPLLPGFVITVEPGIYFIPALIARWKQQKLHHHFIDFARLESYLGFGGIRIEDDVLITQDGQRVLGPKIPKTVQELEDVLRPQ